MLAPKTRGLKEFTSYIDKIARNSRGVVTEVITDYIIGNDFRGLKHYPPQRGQKYIRTFTMRGGWMRRGSGVQSRAENTIYYVVYVQGNRQQWWAGKYGWRSVPEIIGTNIKGAVRDAERAMVKKG